ncbi:hypothetical protein ACO0LF_27500 [Undibacterium sp. Di27W]|uniref:hypothetical protein n=1 Tax=Undibacterium sp. Di27W TaxID=3413036 RepID=UPI003BF0675D
MKQQISPCLHFSAWWWLVASFMGMPVLASAMCTDGRAPTVKAEFLIAPKVVQARVINQKVLQEDAEDPEGVTATEYTIQVDVWYKGASKKRKLLIRDENTSSRFPMDAGESYLLFLTRYRLDFPGQYFIDSCGNSKRMAESEAELKIIRNIKAAKEKKPGIFHQRLPARNEPQLKTLA